MRHASLIFAYFALLIFSIAVCATEKPLPPDVRGIIDISGSMKKNDPHNLRKPAVDLIVRLLPDTSKAGIWTFAQSVNMLMPQGTVDAKWRKDAVEKASAINSVGLFTNIGAALEKVAEDAEHSPKKYQTNLVLLTDGVVDIDKDASVNLAERKRILTQLLPKLKQAGYHIHTIALSEAADQELMKKLSLTTNGVFTLANNAEELMSTFLRIFDQAVPAERVPLEKEGFLVDASIEEFTALIFRKAKVPASVILAPDGKEYSNTDPQNNVNWYKTDQYDLITVQKPVAGKWQVKTEMEPDSRVTVVSNLKLVVAPLKNNLRANQPLKLSYSFEENNKTVAKPEFLNLLTSDAFVAKLKSPLSWQKSLTPEEIPADGVYHAILEDFKEAGDYDVRVVVDGKTFKREFTHHLSIVDSFFKVEKNKSDESEQQTLTYKLIPDLEFIDPTKTQVTAIIEIEPKDRVEKPLSAIANKHWEFSFSPEKVARYNIILNIRGEAIDGVPIDEELRIDAFSFPNEEAVKKANATPKPTPKPTPELTPEPAQEPAVATSSASASAAAVKEEPKPEANNEINNLWLYIGIGLGNLLVIVIGFFAYRLITGTKSTEDLSEIEKTLNTNIADIKKAAPAPQKNESEKTVIDVSDDNKTIPMEGTATPPSSDDLMADNLFPLDNLEDTNNKP